MANSNTYIVAQANVIQNPITFTAGTANTNANIDKILALLATEGAEQSVARGFLDEMSPPARNTIYRILVDLKAANV